MKVEYDSNNSGGHWWLKDKHWIALEKAGWYVLWGGRVFCHLPYNFDGPDPKICATREECRGHRKAETAEAAKNARWLGALAREAHKDVPSLRDAIEEWEHVTGMSASDEGCNCCGAPHSFSADGEYASGDDIVGVLYPGAPTSLRAAAERLATRRR